MKFKEFVKWCEQNSSNYNWNDTMNSYCENIINEVYSIKWWLRERIWKKDYEDIVLRNVVTPFIIKNNEWYCRHEAYSYAEGYSNNASGARSYAEGDNSLGWTAIDNVSKETYINSKEFKRCYHVDSVNNKNI